MGSFLGEEGGLESGWLKKTRETLEIYNVYGRIVTKKPKGCSYYYELLSAHSKKDGWDQAKYKLEAELSEFYGQLEYDTADFMKIVMQIIKMPFLNRLKQFMLKLLRNNLYLGKRAYKVKNPEVSLCYLCNDHRENRSSLFLGCDMVKKQVQFLIRVLIKAGFLQNGNKMGLFIFEN